MVFLNLRLLRPHASAGARGARNLLQESHIYNESVAGGAGVSSEGRPAQLRRGAGSPSGLSQGSGGGRFQRNRRGPSSHKRAGRGGWGGAGGSGDGRGGPALGLPVTGLRGGAALPAPGGGKRGSTRPPPAPRLPAPGGAACRAPGPPAWAPPGIRPHRAQTPAGLPGCPPPPSLTLPQGQGLPSSGARTYRPKAPAFSPALGSAPVLGLAFCCLKLLDF